MVKKENQSGPDGALSLTESRLVEDGSPWGARRDFSVHLPQTYELDRLQAAAAEGGGQ
jgi:hypothetical protein